MCEPFSGSYEFKGEIACIFSVHATFRYIIRKYLHIPNSITGATECQNKPIWWALIGKGWLVPMSPWFRWPCITKLCLVWNFPGLAEHLEVVGIFAHILLTDNAIKNRPIWKVDYLILKCSAEPANSPYHNIINVHSR